MGTSFYFFRKFLFSHNAGSITKSISWLCLFGIGVSMMAMVIVMSVMGGFGNAIEKRILSFEPHIVVKAKDENREVQKKELIDLEKKLEKNFSLNAFLFDQEQVIFRTTDGHYSGAVAKGLEDKSLQHFIEAVRLYNENKVKEFSWKSDIKTPIVMSDNDVLIGSDLAYETGAYIGYQIIMTPPESLLLPPGEVPQFKKMNVQDVLRTSVQRIDSEYIIYKKIPHKTLFRDSLSLETQLEIYLDKVDQLQNVINSIDRQKFSVETWQDRNSTLFYSLKMERMMIGFFLFLSVLIGCFTIVTVLVLLTTQKQSDIGILLTLGMNKKELVKKFSHIGFFLSMAGVLGGFIVGLFICWLLSTHQFIILPDVYYDRTIPVQFDFKIYFLILLLSLVVSYLSARYPARLLSSLEISQILRKKN